jgi:hypothetical protein
VGKWGKVNIQTCPAVDDAIINRLRESHTVTTIAV